MATEAIEKDYVTIRVPQAIGTTGIKRIKQNVKVLEANTQAPKRISKKRIKEIANEVTTAAWEKLKQKRGL